MDKTVPVLQLENIERHYHQAATDLHILQGVTLAIARGEKVALVGPSGCGKTTLLQIAGLLDSPDAGEIKVCGKPMAKARDAERTAVRQQSLGFVYQFHHLLPEFTALENILLPARFAGQSIKEARERAESLLAHLGLQDRGGHRPAALSGGEQQRVAIARALVNNPALLLADEPTGNLDPNTAERVMQFLDTALQESGSAMLMVTHNTALARRADRVVTLEDGRVVPL